MCDVSMIGPALGASAGPALGVASAGMTAFGEYKAAKAEKAQLKAQKKAAEYDARAAEENARDSIFRGEMAAQAVRRAADQTGGAQRAAFAGAGVDVNYGTAADLQDETNFFGQVDALRERHNAANEAKGLRQQGERAMQQASAYGKAAKNVNPLLNATTSLVGGLAPVAEKWYPRKATT